MAWEEEFKQRMDGFSREGSGFPVSIKVRVDSGCFHREHSPNAYKMIGKVLRATTGDKFSFVEHESGPEILAYIALTTAGVSLAASVINLVVTIIKARAEGIKKGDGAQYPIELIVRGFGNAGNLSEEKILRFDPKDKVSKEIITKALQKAAKKITSTKKKSKGK